MKRLIIRRLKIVAMQYHFLSIKMVKYERKIISNIDKYMRKWKQSGIADLSVKQTALE